LAEFKTLLRAAYVKEPPNPVELYGLLKQGDLWWHQGHVFVPTTLHPQVLHQFHNYPLAGHLGSLKTLDSLGRTVNWPGMRKDIIAYVKSCFLCQRAKHSTQKPPSQMHSFQFPNHPWSCFVIDFIFKLPLSSGFDSVLVIMDHFSKGVHLILANKTWLAEEFV
jgi:hypothetical protein